MTGIRDYLASPQVEAAEDYGFFGPGSITWKVWSYPTSLTIGFQRSVVIEELDPALVAAVDKTHEIYKRPRTRYDRTLRYFSMVAFGGSAATVKAADVLVKIHSKAVGTDEVTGIRYDANDPKSQLWIHLTAWHSILIAYEKYGPGKLTEQEEAQYWKECALAAELQTCDLADVPTSRDGIRRYFDEMRPQLLGSGIAKKAMNHLLNAEVMLPKMHPVLRPGAVVAAAFLRQGTLATMPKWMRQMSDLPVNPVLDAAVTPALRLAFKAISLNTRAQLVLLNVLSPTTVAVAAPVLRKIPAKNPVTTTPREAQARLGFDPPALAHKQFRDRQKARVFDEGVDPSDEGIIESQRILGSVG